VLTRAENERLTRTGRGSPMGELMRRYWIPALFSEKLPKPDCPPLRLTLLGEKLVAIRDSTGRVALFDERCPHRGASLFFGRNEEGGLRCVYHGWKFDSSGACVDMPSEPAESNFKNKVRITAYPCVERGGVVWAYMGPLDLKPGEPSFEWALVPQSHRYATRHLQECNWFQGLEGGFDMSHLPLLHRGDTTGGNRALPTMYETVWTDFGFASASGRKLPDGRVLWLVNLMLMPFHKVITPIPGGDHPIGVHMWVPVDDGNCMIWSIEYRPDRPLSGEEMERSRNGLYVHAECLPGSDRAVQSRDNDYLVDRELQASGRSYTGIRGLGMQDCGIQESMGPIADRSRENLRASDLHIVHLRRGMFRALERFAEGAAPAGLESASHRVRSASFTIAENAPLEPVLEERLRTGVVT
jgi:phthalate 4,5-dioxygenase oxygenase subunit